MAIYKANSQVRKALQKVKSENTPKEFIFSLVSRVGQKDGTPYKIII